MEFALHYAAHGMHIFPCYPDDDPDRHGKPIGEKTPEGRGGFYLATTDAEQIRDWWTRYPDAAIGWRLAADGFVAVDLDCKDGRDGVARWAELTGSSEFATDLVADTPRGGVHLVFRTDDPAAFRSTTDKENGIDIRGDGGYLVIPNGRGSRAWRNLGPTFDQVGELKGKDLSEVTARAATDTSLRRKSKPTKGRSLELYQDVASPYVEVESALLAIPPSCGRSTWLECIYAVHDALHGSAEGAALVEDWSSRSNVEGQYTPGEARKVYADASVGEVRKATLFHHAKQHGWRPPATRDQVALGPKFQNTTPDVGGVLGVVPNAWGPPTPSRRKVTLRDADEVAAMDVPAWRVLNVLPDASVSLLVGDTMVGKTFVALDLALRLQHGMEFMGHDVDPCSTVYLPGEGFGGLTSRVLGWKQQHNPDPADADGRYVLIGDEVPELGSNLAAAAAAIRDVIEDAVAKKGHAPGLVIVDTLSQALTADENDATATSAAFRVFSDLRHDYGCSFLVLHHPRKQQATQRERGPHQVKLDDTRGSSALTRNADAVLVVQQSGDDGFELHAAKQKGGRCGFLARFDRIVVHTDRVGGFGEQESTCILVPSSNRGEVTQQERKRAAKEAQFELDRQSLLQAFDQTPCFSSKENLVSEAGGNARRMRAALDRLIARGEVVVGGTARDVRVELGTVKDPESVCVWSPHTPPWTLDAEASPSDGVREAVDDERTMNGRRTMKDDQAVQIPRPEPELVEPEDQGRPRKPGASRRRSKR